MSDDPASLRRMTDDELLGVLGSVEPDAPLAEQVKREMQARLADRQALRRGRRGFVYLAAIACWLVLWVGTISVGLDLGQRMVGPQGRDGYLALTGLYGVLLIPLGLACSMLFLWVEATRVSLPRLCHPSRARHHVVAVPLLLGLGLTDRLPPSLAHGPPTLDPKLVWHNDPVGTHRPTAHDAIAASDPARQFPTRSKA